MVSRKHAVGVSFYSYSARTDLTYWGSWRVPRCSAAWSPLRGITCSPRDLSSWNRDLWLTTMASDWSPLGPGSRSNGGCLSPRWRTETGQREPRARPASCLASDWSIMCHITGFWLVEDYVIWYSLSWAALSSENMRVMYRRGRYIICWYTSGKNTHFTQRYIQS